MKKRTLQSLLVASSFGLFSLLPFAKADMGPELLQPAVERTVQLLMVGRDGKELGTCSGSFVSPRGIIITAAHCIYASEDMPELGIKKGEQIHPDGLAIVGVNLPGKVKPVFAFAAKKVVDNRAFDFAVLRVTGMMGEGGAKELPADLRFPYMKIGDHEMKFGESIVVLGFPGVGGDTITVVKGIVSGYIPGEDGNPLFMKHDAEAGPGMSGGPVINDKAEVVGIHVAGVRDSKSVSRSLRATLMKPVFQSLAQYLKQRPDLAPYFQEVTATAFTSSAPPANPNPVTLPPVAPQPSAAPVMNAPQVPSTPPQPVATGVVIRSRVVDAGSGTGIPGALVGIFKPGSNPQTVTKEDVIAMGVSDSTGFVQTRPPVPRGAQYPVLIMAKGYQSISGPLNIASDAPDILDKPIVELNRQ